MLDAFHLHRAHEILTPACIDFCIVFLILSECVVISMKSINVMMIKFMSMLRLNYAFIILLIHVVQHLD